jgi:predicted transcriptional regulator
MRSVNVALPDDLAEKLIELAQRERRTPREQAAIVLTRALRRVAIRESKAAEATAHR